MMGISRSATVVCAYLVATTPLSAPDAIEFVRGRRGVVCPNLGFRQQLETYDDQVPNKSRDPKASHKALEVMEAAGKEADAIVKTEPVGEIAVSVVGRPLRKVLRIHWLSKLIEKA